MFVRAVLELPDMTGFWVEPSSETGKHHPADEFNSNGLTLHTRRVVAVHAELARSFPGTSAKSGDIQIAACILHDSATPFARSIGQKNAHPILFRGLARHVDNFVSDYVFNSIAELVEAHMGKWSVIPGLYNPNNQDHLMMHMADYIASRENILVGVD